jgi:tRNA G10  N-methylase Trm11
LLVLTQAGEPALSVGAHGTDIDPDSVRAARTNAHGATICPGDARQLRFEDASVAACVSNLPFGQRYDVDGGMDEWLRAVRGELCRVTRPGGRVVLLTPRIPRSVTPDRLARTGRLPIGLLGARTTVWAFHRR